MIEMGGLRILLTENRHHTPNDDYYLAHVVIEVRDGRAKVVKDRTGAFA